MDGQLHFIVLHGCDYLYMIWLDAGLVILCYYNAPVIFVL